MSKKNFQKQKAQKLKQLRKQAKKNRQKNDPVKWEEKKAKKKATQQVKWNSLYPGVNPDCELSLSTFPSPKNCSACNLPCRYKQD